MVKKMGLLVAGFAALMLSGCGDEAAKPTSNTPAKPSDMAAPAKPADAAPAAAKVAFPKDKATAEISGTVKLDGEASPMKQIQVDSDKYCGEKHKDSPAMKEDLIVNAENKGVMNAFVYVKTGASGWSYDVPTEPVVVEQHGCIYVPHVIGVMAKQPVHVNSKDATTHNVHFVSKGANESVNKTEVENQSLPFMFNKAEMGDFFKCDVHSWMQCQVQIMDNPFFCVTDKDGKYTLPKLPAGEYELAVWQEKLGETSQKIKVEDGKAQTVDFALKSK